MSPATIFGACADLHMNNWNAFSQANSDGENSRLRIQIDELLRCAEEVRDRGGKYLVVAGDVFHVRGSLAPSVLNPVSDAFERITKEFGLFPIILSGNHDLESRDSSRLSSSVTALEKAGCTIIHETTVMEDLGFAMIPWFERVRKNARYPGTSLQEAIESIDPAKRKDLVLFIHAPIDGVIEGLPAHGLTPEYLQDLGFKAVFSGHYHNYKDLGGGVYSIGASTQQTWSDVGHKAGFIIYDNGKVEWRASRAPEFVEIDADTDPEEIPMIVDGNYVRAKFNVNKASDIEAARSFLTKQGAKGVVILPQKAVAAIHERGTTSIKTGASVEASISSYISAGSFSNTAALELECNAILSEVRSSK